MNAQNLDKDTVSGFLEMLDRQLRERLRQAVRDGGKSISQQVIDIRKDAAELKDKVKAHLKQPEAAFLNSWVAPAIHAALTSQGLSEKMAHELLLAESYAALKKFASGPAARPVAFPFDKKMGVSARTVYDRWIGKTKEQPFKQPYPDLAVRAPYGIVFEGKYFRSGSRDYAERQLVTAIHESLFYLGVPETEARGRAWSYRYACLVAFDASSDGALASAWNRLKEVRQKFWECANLKVIMIGEQEIAG